MYAVVGCGECSNLWIVEGRAETSTCPRCGTRRAYADRRRFVETEDPDRAREARAAMLAARQDASEAFASVPSVDELEAVVEDGVIDDATYLADSGLDVEAVDAAGDPDATGSSRSGSRREIVERAIASLDDPTEEAIVERASERGVPASATRSILEKLHRTGTVVRRGDSYHLV